MADSTCQYHDDCRHFDLTVFDQHWLKYRIQPDLLTGPQRLDDVVLDFNFLRRPQAMAQGASTQATFRPRTLGPGYQHHLDVIFGAGLCYMVSISIFLVLAANR